MNDLLGSGDSLSAPTDAYNRGRYDEAQRMLEAALPELERQFPDDVPLAELLSLLASTLTLNGRYDRAEQVLRRAIEIYSARIGRSSPE